MSYTGQDLEAHAEVVSDMVKRLNADTGRSWVAIDHKFWAPTGRPSVKECMEQVARCHVLIVLVAFRYGWVPTAEEGGDGESSIVRMEVERARAAGLEVIPFLVEDNARWSIANIEGLSDPKAQERLSRFKAELRKSLAGFFETPESLEAPTVLALNKAAERIERSRGGPRSRVPTQDRPGEAERVVPSYFDPDHPPTLEERLETQLPKRILSLDSGGVRTAIVLGYLERLEQLLRVRYRAPDFRLSDYFDLIGASGASAIVAAELARGGSVADAARTFTQSIQTLMASKSLLGMTLTGARFRAEPLSDVLQQSFGNLTVGSTELKSGLAIVLTRIDTGEICSLTNHPRVRSSTLGSLPLAQVLLAATATPAFLPPVSIRAGNDSGIYISGELSVGPDPALHLFLVATGPSFPFRWRTGRRRLFLASIGAGAPPLVKREPGTSFFSLIGPVISAMVAGLKQQSDLALGALTHEDTLALSAPMPETPSAESAPSILNYRRFEVPLDAATMKKIGLPELADDIESILMMDRPDRIASHLDIGRRCGERDLHEDLFSLSFDVRPGAGQGDASGRGE